MKLGLKYKVTLKTNIIVLMLMTVVWTGCSTEEEIRPTDGTERPIVFGSVVSAGGSADDTIETRAKALSGVIPDGSSFGIAAYRVIGSSTYVYGYIAGNTEVERNGSKYTYSPVTPWPTGSDKVKFFAYYPYVAQAGEKGITVSWGQGVSPLMAIDYTLSTNPAEHQDLLYTSTDNLTSQDAVALTFHHALTRVSFEAKVSAGGYAPGTVKVTGLRLKNVASKGTLTVASAATWAISTSEAQKKTIAMTTANGLDGSKTLTGTLQSILAADGTGEMMLLPQSLAGIELEVDILPAGNSHTLTYTIPLSGSWAMNGYVNYRLDVSPSDVTLTAQVNDWANPEVVTIMDGQYYLNIGRPDYKCAGEGITGNITIAVKTNHPEGLNIGLPEYNGAAVNWTQTLTSGANQNYTIEVQRIDPTATARRATIPITAGNLTYNFRITQTAGEWLTRADGATFPLDGDVHSFYVDSDYPWVASLGSGTAVDYLYTASGGKKNNEQVVFITGNDSGSLQQQVVFKDPENIRPQKTIVLEFN